MTDPRWQSQQNNPTHKRPSHKETRNSPLAKAFNRPDKYKPSSSQTQFESQNPRADSTNRSNQNQGFSLYYQNSSSNHPVATWPNTLMQQPNYTFSNPAPQPFYMYPQMPMVPGQGFQFPQPVPVLNQPMTGPRPGSPISNTAYQPPFSYTSPVSTASDYNLRERRISYDPHLSHLSLVVHV